jgi:hypothetical protein
MGSSSGLTVRAGASTMLAAARRVAALASSCLEEIPMLRPLLAGTLSLSFLCAGHVAAQDPPKPASKALRKITPAPRAAEKSQEELIAMRDKILAKPVFQKAHWRTDYDKARAEAKQTGKPIFAYFTRSYAY